MATVYLDQAQWIDLGKAMHGRDGGGRYEPALAAARDAVAEGIVEFPLSRAHYIETWRAADPGRRARLAQTMISLSRGFTMASPPDLCDNELDAMLGRLFDMAPPRPWPVFGFTFGHVAKLTDALSSSDVVEEIEIRQLSERPPGFSEHGRGHREFGDLYRAGEEQLGEGGRDRGESKDLQEAVIAGSAVMEIYENIEWALGRAGLSADALGPIGRVRPDLPRGQIREVLDGLLPMARGFIAELPTRDAALRLRILRHQNPANRWESNDLNDIAYLACAAVHCDVVVTEKQWVHELRRSGLLEDHSTQALGDVAALPDVLQELASS